MGAKCAALFTALITAGAFASSGCSGGAGSLRPDTPATVSLAGTWRLNRQASEDPQAMIERIRQNAMKHMRRRDELSDALDDDEPQGEEGSSTSRRSPRGGGQRQSGEQNGGDGERRFRYMPRVPYPQALGAALTADSLTIEQSPTRFVIIRGDDRRSFTPGGESVVSVPEGVADQHSGWSGREYVIEVRPQVGARVIERYGLSADGHQLVEKFTLTAEGWPKLEFTRVYEQGAVNTRALPTSN